MDAAVTANLEIDQFWAWINNHYNCILRAGGMGFVLFDQPDVHWHLWTDPEGMYIVQLLRGKDTTAEFYLNPGEVLYVVSSPGEGEETLFELVGGAEGEATPMFHFLMSHPFEAEELARPIVTH